MYYWYLIYGLERAQSTISYAATLTNDTPDKPLVIVNPLPIPEARSLDQLAESLVLLGDARARESFYFLHSEEAASLQLPSVRKVVAVNWQQQQAFLRRYRAYAQQTLKI